MKNSTAIIISLALFIMGLALNLSAKSANVTYDGRVRIYMVEPTSRYKMFNNQPYDFGFLGFAYDTVISLEPDQTLNRSIDWSYAGITESNIMAIAAVFNSEVHEGQAKPDDTTYPFDAYYVDACAAADVSNNWPNEVMAGFTHTVLVEKGTATWCEFCPKTAAALKYIYENNGYPFFFVSLIWDITAVPDAKNRYWYELNRYGDPTCFFGGGYEVFVRGTDTLSFYETRIESCGAREVPPLDLSVDLTWQGGGTITIDLFLKNPGGSTPVDDNNVAGLPADHQLAQNYPNPFNPSTFIAYTLSRKSDVNISVYDILGRKVTSLVDESQPAGNYQIEWNGSDMNGGKVAAGVYFYLMRTNDFSETRKMILLK